MSDKLREAPKRIYLQWYPQEFDGEDCSWCSDKIDENDTEYIRADTIPKHETVEQWEATRYKGGVMSDNIDFIKWLCDKAEGFEWDDVSKRIQFHPYIYTKVDNGHMRFIYPLLIQKAILDEYKNLRYTVIPVFYDGEWEVNLYDYEDVKLLKCSTGKTYDEAMESALKYIWEQEQKQ